MATRRRNNAATKSASQAPSKSSAKSQASTATPSWVTPLRRGLLLGFSILCLGWVGYAHYSHYVASGTPGSTSSPVQSRKPNDAARLQSEREQRTKQLERQFNSFSPRPSLPFDVRPRNLPHNPITIADEPKRDAVKAAFQSSWSAYVSEAWGSDEYHPLSHRGTNLSVDGGLGYTIIDTLDTLIIFGEEAEYKRARNWVKTNLHGGSDKWGKGGKMNVFETVIRTLGGLLSAHALCTEHPSNIEDLTSPFYRMCDPGDAQMFLETAEQLAQHLQPAFNTPTGIPKREVDFRTGEAFADVDNGGASSLAEATTIQMEFKYLSYLTQEKSLWAMAERPMKAVREAMRTGTQDGLLPIFISAETGQFFLGPVRLGSRGDSYFEYLIKQYVQTNRSEEVYRDMFDRSMTGVKKHLIQKSTFSDPPFLFTSEIIPRVMGKGQAPIFRLLPKQDHLACFLGGALMLGAHDFGAPYAGAKSGSLTISAVQREDWAVGHEVLRGCMATYQETTTGLSPEISFWRAPNDPQGKEEDWYIKQPPPEVKGRKAAPLIDARNILRPETVESLFVAFHLSGDPIYREWGWEIFQAFEKHCKLPNGAYAGIKDVDADLAKVEHEDKMVSDKRCGAA